MSEESYDIAIYIGAVRNQDLPMRRLASLPRSLFASPHYLARRGVPRGRDDLAAQDCIALESQVQDGLWQLHGPDGAGESNRGIDLT